MEEIGEVAKALQGDGDLKEELVHSAAVCVRWLEYLNKKDSAEISAESFSMERIDMGKPQRKVLNIAYPVFSPLNPSIIPLHSL